MFLTYLWLGIGGAISTPFGSTAFGSGQSIAVGRR